MRPSEGWGICCSGIILTWVQSASQHCSYLKIHIVTESHEPDKPFYSLLHAIQIQIEKKTSLHIKHKVGQYHKKPTTERMRDIASVAITGLEWKFWLVGGNLSYGNGGEQRRQNARLSLLRSFTVYSLLHNDQVCRALGVLMRQKQSNSPEARTPTRFCSRVAAL